MQNGCLASSTFGQINIWNTDDGSLIRTILAHNDKITSLAVLSNGDLASAGADNTIKIWNKNNFSLTSTLTGHTDLVIGLTVLLNGNLASASADTTVKLWNIDTVMPCN